MMEFYKVSFIYKEEVSGTRDRVYRRGVVIVPGADIVDARRTAERAVAGIYTDPRNFRPVLLKKI